MLLIISILTLSSCSTNHIEVSFYNFETNEKKHYSSIKNLEEFEVADDFFKDSTYYEVNGIFIFQESKRVGLLPYSYINYEGSKVISKKITSFVQAKYDSDYSKRQMRINWYEGNSSDNITIIQNLKHTIKIRVGDFYGGKLILNEGVYEIFGYDSKGNEIGSMLIPNLGLVIEHNNPEEIIEGKPILQKFNVVELEIFIGNTKLNYILPYQYNGGLNFADITSEEKYMFDFFDSTFEIKCIFEEIPSENTNDL